MNRVHNFAAGPCVLPTSVIEELAAELPDYNNSGMSLIEMSHRSPTYTEVHNDTISRLTELYQIPDDFAVLLLQGGATLQYSMVPLNALPPGKKAGYINSGAWAKKAIADAQTVGNAYVAWDGEAEKFTRMPDPEEVNVSEDTSFIHLVSNETIGGIRMADFHDYGVPTIADMSSEMLGRPIPWDRFDLVYGGAQKNAGPAGLTMVFVRRSLVEQAPSEMPSYLKYQTHVKGNSVANTPPVFAICATNKMLRWIELNGGLESMEKRAEARSGSIYSLIDGSDDFYTNPNRVEDRSLTNVVFRLRAEDLETKFLEEAESKGLVNLKGHRSVGGVRASIYNGLPDASVDALATFMTDFQKANG